MVSVHNGDKVAALFVQVSVVCVGEFTALKDVSPIGATEIDLENRRHSDLLFLNKETVGLELIKLDEKRKILNQRKAKEVKGKPLDHADRKKFEKKDKEMKDEKVKLNALLKELKNVEQVYAPIEFRELFHPQKS